MTVTSRTGPHTLPDAADPPWTARWEITFQDLDGNWGWYWTDKITFHEAVLDAIAQSHTKFRNCDLISIKPERTDQ